MCVGPVHLNGRGEATACLSHTPRGDLDACETSKAHTAYHCAAMKKVSLGDGVSVPRVCPRVSRAVSVDPLPPQPNAAQFWVIPHPPQPNAASSGCTDGRWVLLHLRGAVWEEDHRLPRVAHTAGAGKKITVYRGWLTQPALGRRSPFTEGGSHCRRRVLVTLRGEGSATVEPWPPPSSPYATRTALSKGRQHCSRDPPPV